MQEIIDACVLPAQSVIYLPIYVPQSLPTELSKAQLLGPAVAGTAALMVLTVVAWMLWKFVRVETCRIFFVEDYEVAQIQRARRHYLKVS